MEGFALHAMSNSLIQNDTCDLNHQSHVSGTCAVPSGYQGEPTSNAHADTRITNQADVAVPVVAGQSIMSLESSCMRGASAGNLSPLASRLFQEQFFGYEPPAVAPHFPVRNSFQESFSNLAPSGSPVYPFEQLHPYVLNHELNSSGVSSINCGGCDVFGRADGKENLGQLQAALEHTGGKTPIRSEVQLFSSIRNPELAMWMSTVHENLSPENPYNSGSFSNELSLSLSTSRSSVIDGRSVQDKCSELSSGITRLGSDQASCTSKELSLSCSSYGPDRLSKAICGSKYLHVMQEILAEFAFFQTQNMEQTYYPSGGVKAGPDVPFSSLNPTEGGIRSMDSDESSRLESLFEVPLELSQQKRAQESKKMQLLSLLQLVDDRYNQYLDEIHTVVSAFHAATELDPQMHTQFVLQTISYLYKSLRAKISNQILAMGVAFDSGEKKETEKSSGTGVFQDEEQWDVVQQLKRKDQQLWRPQRGLPETSVSVLRAWMFQNFLHPYPKDAEKHLLAVKSGLTRSQVSNWFINARVRLWKPMIEEMCAEMNTRKARHIGS